MVTGPPPVYCYHNVAVVVFKDNQTRRFTHAI